MTTNPGLAPLRPSPSTRMSATRTPLTSPTRPLASARSIGSLGRPAPVDPSRRSYQEGARALETGWDAVPPGPVAPSDALPDEVRQRLMNEMRDLVRETFRTTARSTVRDAVDETLASFLHAQQALEERLTRLEGALRTGGRGEAGGVAGTSEQGRSVGETLAFAPTYVESAASPALDRQNDIWAAVHPSAVENPASVVEAPLLRRESLVSSVDLPGALNGARRRRMAIFLIMGVLLLILGSVLITTLISQTQ